MPRIHSKSSAISFQLVPNVSNSSSSSTINPNCLNSSLKCPEVSQFCSKCFELIADRYILLLSPLLLFSVVTYSFQRRSNCSEFNAIRLTVNPNAMKLSQSYLRCHRMSNTNLNLFQSRLNSTPLIANVSCCLPCLSIASICLDSSPMPQLVTQLPWNFSNS